MKLTDCSIQVIRHEMVAADFAVVKFKAEDRNRISKQLMDFAEVAGLGRPYVPSLYQSGASMIFSAGFGLNDVGGPSTAAGHPAFSMDAELDPHTDGTLEPIGMIQTSVLVCVQPAMSGGETLVFRTAAVVEGMVPAEFKALEPLFDGRALRRHSTIKDRNDYSEGPVFAVKDGRIIGRYCVSPRDEWRYAKVPGLRRARQFFEERLAVARSARYEVRLAAGQALIMNNSRVSHGRHDFQSFPGAPRHLLRGLFRGHL